MIDRRGSLRNPPFLYMFKIGQWQFAFMKRIVMKRSKHSTRVRCLLLTFAPRTQHSVSFWVRAVPLVLYSTFFARRRILIGCQSDAVSHFSCRKDPEISWSSGLPCDSSRFSTFPGPKIIRCPHTLRKNPSCFYASLPDHGGSRSGSRDVDVQLL